MIGELTYKEPEDLTPEVLQKLATLLTDGALDFNGFSTIWSTLQKDVAEMGYSSVSAMVADYELADTLWSTGLLDDYLPKEVGEADFSAYTVTFPK